jgi:dihydroorotate dehydrogenase (NAD+) catalytic subunit
MRRTSGRRSGTDMTASVGRLTLPNPVMTASGTAGHGAELEAYVVLSSLGAVVVKSLSPGPWAGNPPPRVHQTSAGMLNSVGLQNPGIEAWLAEELPELGAAGARVVASVWGFTASDYGRVAKALATGGHSDTSATGAIVAVEVNISCPNVEDRLRMFAHSPEGTAEAVGQVADALSGTGIAVWAKLSPNVTDLTEIGAAALGAGAEGLTLVNTMMGLALDPATGRPCLGGGGGGLSGPALHPVAVRAVFECRRAFPAAAIVGVGGVMNGRDAAELLAAGADAVQVGTATFADPRAPSRVLAELEAWCRNHAVARVADLIGRAHASR